MLQSLRRSTVTNATTVTTVTIIIVTVVLAKQHHVCLLLVILTRQYIGAQVLRLTRTGKHVATVRPSYHCFRACSLFYIDVLHNPTINRMKLVLRMQWYQNASSFNSHT